VQVDLDHIHLAVVFQVELIEGGGQVDDGGHEVAEPEGPVLTDISLDQAVHDVGAQLKANVAEGIA